MSIDIDSLTRDLERADKENQGIEDKVRDAQRIVEQLDGQIKRKKDELKNLEDEKAKVEREIEGNEKLIKTHQDKIATLGDQIEKLGGKAPQTRSRSGGSSGSKGWW